MVHVIIKAANGAVKDFSVNSAEPQWTVAELKNYLYRHYATHPPVPSQKLIYRGQLLENSQQLSSILTHRNEDTDKVIIHLVAYDRSVSAPTIKSNVSHPVVNPSQSVHDVSDGGEEREEGRERTINETRTSNTSTDRDRDRESSTPAVAPAQHHSIHPWLRYRPHPQHMQRFPGGPVPNNFPMFPMGGGGLGAGGAAGYPYPPPFYMPPYTVADHAHLQQWYHAYYARPGMMDGGVGGVGGGGGDGGVVAGEVGRDGDDIDIPNIPDQPDNPDLNQDDLPMNAGGAGGMMLAGPQLQARRDLVDYSYMFLMATVLVTVAYLTSSFGRIILFLAGVLFMFMNQAGWFSLQRRPRNVAANVDREDDLPDPLDRHRQQERGGEREEEAREGAEPERATDDRDSTDSNQSPHPVGPASVEPPPPGIISVFFTFITSLFTSLLPQQQPDIHLQ